MVSDRSIRIGVIGGGMMSQVGHLPFLLADDRCRVVAVAESRPSLVAALSADSRIGRVMPHHRELLNDPDVDAVVISLPRPATAAATMEALKAGKHVLAEKPMALTYEEAAVLAAEARARGLIYGVGFMKRYDPGVQAAREAFRELMATGRLGRLLLARFFNFAKVYAVPVPPHVRPSESRVERFPVGKEWPDWLPPAQRANYGWFLNSASHTLNLMHYFFDGSFDVLSAVSPVEGSVTALCRQGEANIALEAARSAVGVWREGAEFLFENGRLALDIPSPMATDKVGTVTLEENVDAVRAVTLAAGQGWCFARQAADFVSAVAAERQMLTDGDAGLRDMMLNDRIWKMIAA